MYSRAGARLLPVPPALRLANPLDGLIRLYSVTATSTVLWGAGGAVLTTEAGASLAGAVFPARTGDPLAVPRRVTGVRVEVERDGTTRRTVTFRDERPRAGAWVSTLPAADQPAAWALLRQLGVTRPDQGLPVAADYLRPRCGRAGGLLDALTADAEGNRATHRSRCLQRSVAITRRCPTTGALARTIHALPCRDWSCPTCAPRRVEAERARLRAQLRQDRAAGLPWVMVTLTLNPSTVPAEVAGNAAATQLWACRVLWERTVQRWRRNAGVTAWWRMVEFHSDGRPHVNVLLRGDLDPQALLREARAAGWGRQGHAGRVENAEAVINERCKTLQIAQSYARVHIIQASQRTHAWWGVREVDDRPATVTAGPDGDTAEPLVQPILTESCPRGWRALRSSWPTVEVAVHAVPAWFLLGAGSATLAVRFEIGRAAEEVPVPVPVPVQPTHRLATAAPLDLATLIDDDAPRVVSADDNDERPLCV